METRENQLQLYENYSKYWSKRSQVLPEVASLGDDMRETVYKDGILSRKMKRLIGVAVALSTGCQPCIIGQTKAAVEAGATAKEVLEAASVIMAMHGTTGYTESWRVVKVLEELDTI